jgi:hypothetical protein
MIKQKWQQRQNKRNLIEFNKTMAAPALSRYSEDMKREKL